MTCNDRNPWDETCNDRNPWNAAIRCDRPPDHPGMHRSDPDSQAWQTKTVLRIDQPSTGEIQVVKWHLP